LGITDGRVENRQRISHRRRQLPGELEFVAWAISPCRHESRSMQRLLEIILGLDKGFLGKQGEFSIQFNPKWPLQEVVGAVTWNLLLIALAAFLVTWVYRREGRSRFAKILLGVMRAALLLFVIALLNRPVLNLSQSRTEPSVLAVLMD